MFALAALTIFLIVRSNRRFRAKNVEDSGDTLFQTILSTKDQKQVWQLLVMFITDRQRSFISFAEESYRDMTAAFVKEDVKTLDRTENALVRQNREKRMVPSRKQLLHVNPLQSAPNQRDMQGTR